MIADIHRQLFRQIFSSVYKPDAIAFRVSIRHRLDLILTERIQKLGCLQLAFRHILAKSVKITQIRQIRIQDNTSRKISGRIHTLTNALRHKHITVIADKPVNDLLNFFVGWQLLLLKTIVDFNKKFQMDHGFFQQSLKNIADDSSQFCIKETQNLSVNLSQNCCGIIWISKTQSVMFRQNVLVHFPVYFLPLLQRKVLRRAGDQLFPNTFHLHQKLRHRFKIRIKRCRNCLFLQYTFNAIHGQSITLLHRIIYKFQHS